MKFLSYPVVLLFASFLYYSCGSKKLSVKKQNERFIEIPCSGGQDKSYASNKKYLRASSIGESRDQMLSKKKALSNAKSFLAQSVKSVVKGTVDNYTSSRELNNTEEVEERFESLTREVINLRLNNVKTICEKQVVTEKGTYKTYVAIEMSAEELKNSINDTLSKDQKLKADYDYEKFKKTFDEEMEKTEE